MWRKIGIIVLTLSMPLPVLAQEILVSQETQNIEETLIQEESVDTYLIEEKEIDVDNIEEKDVTLDNGFMEAEKINITVDTKEGNVKNNGYLLSTGKIMVKDNITYVSLASIVREIYNGQITWNKETNTVEIKIMNLDIQTVIGEKGAIKNGEEMRFTYPVIYDNGTVYCSLKTLEPLFNMNINYEPLSPIIHLTAPAYYLAPVITSHADFILSSDVYVQGQEISAQSQCYDDMGLNIVQEQWMLDEDQSRIKSNFNTLAPLIKPGTHSVALRVKNSNGVWSEWTSHMVTMLPNEKPVITSIDGGKEVYGQGDPMMFTYQFTNEEWEAITDERWFYKSVDESDNSKVNIKPERIFEQGEYIVGLQIKDAFGNWSDVYTTVFKIDETVYDTEFNYKFTQGTSGTIIDNFNKRNYRDFEEVEIAPIHSTGGTYILSDSPEVVTQNGILYQDYIEGTGRVNFYHTNAFLEDEKNKKLIVMAENVTDVPITLQVKDKTIKGPTLDALYAGQLLLKAFFRGNGHLNYELQPGEKLFLIDTKDKNWYKDQLLTGLFDVVTTGKTKFTIAAVDKNMTEESIAELPYLERDVHPRGTYNVTDMYYDIEVDSSKETYFILGKDSNEWNVGYDAILNETTLLRGNYGITYHLKITADEDTGIILNPRGGGFRGAIKINDVYTYMIPENSILGIDNTKAAVIYTVKKGETVNIDYMLPNASASPVLFGMIPKSYWK